MALPRAVECGRRTHFLWSFVAVAGFGIWRHWRTAPLAVGFFAMWMAAPIIGLVAVTD